MYKVSIIMPVYNNEKTIERAIKSLLNQSIYNIELILIDDGSTDASLEVCKAYAISEPLLVEVIQQKKSGFGVANNKGLQIAKGDYVYFANASFSYDYKMLEDNVALAEEKSADLVVFGLKDGRRLSADGNLHQLPRMPHLSTQEDFRNHYRNFHQFYPYSLYNKLYNKRFLDKNRLNFYPNSENTSAIFNLNVYKSIQRAAFNRTSYYEIRHCEIKEVYRVNLFQESLERIRALESLFLTWGYEKEFQDIIALEYYQAILCEMKNFKLPSSPMSITEQENKLQIMLEDEHIQAMLNNQSLSSNLNIFHKALLIALRNKNSKAALQLFNGRKETKMKTLNLSRWLRKLVNK